MARKTYLGVDEYVYPLLTNKIINIVDAIILSDINYFCKNYNNYYKKNRTIAEELNISDRTVSRVIKTLENELNFIRTKQITRGRMIEVTTELHNTILSLNPLHGQNVYGRQNGEVPRQNGEVNNLDKLSTLPRQNGEVNILDKNKEKNKEKNKSVYFENTELNLLFLDFLSFRKKHLKAANTSIAIGRLIDKLKNVSEDEAIEMLNESIVNSWKSVFPLRKKNNYNSNKRTELVPQFNSDEQDEKLKAEYEKVLEEMGVKQ